MLLFDRSTLWVFIRIASLGIRKTYFFKCIVFFSALLYLGLFWVVVVFVFFVFFFVVLLLFCLFFVCFFGGWVCVFSAFK